MRKLSTVIVSGICLATFLGSLQLKPHALPILTELHRSGVNNQNVPVKVSATLPTTAQEQPAFSIVYPASPDAGATDIAHKLGVHGTVHIEDGSARIDDGPRHFEHDSAGAISVIDTVNYLAARKKTLDTHEVARRVADNALKTLLPEHATIRRVDWKMSTATVTDVGTGTKQEFPIEHNFLYQFNYDSLPLTGPGAQARIFIGEDNAIDSFLLVFPQLESAGEHPIISAGDALNRLKERGIATATAADSLEITSADLEFYVPATPPVVDTNAAPRLVQPVYVFKGIASHGGTTEQFVEMVQAASDVK